MPTYGLLLYQHTVDMFRVPWLTPHWSYMKMYFIFFGCYVLTHFLCGFPTNILNIFKDNDSWICMSLALKTKGFLKLRIYFFYSMHYHEFYKGFFCFINAIFLHMDMLKMSWLIPKMFLFYLFIHQRQHWSCWVLIGQKVVVASVINHRYANKIQHHQTLKYFLSYITQHCMDSHKRWHFWI